MLVTRLSTPFFAKTQAGGKGYNLFLLSQAGLPVPDWVVFGRQYFEAFLNESHLRNLLPSILLDFEAKNISGAQAEQKILELFLQAGPTVNLQEGIRFALNIFQSNNNSNDNSSSRDLNNMYSVRSSAADEDSTSHSFAGQLSSFLYVQEDEAKIADFILRCWASAYSARGLSYRTENKINLTKISVAVVLQKMIDPDKSGVLFTCDPVGKNLSTYVVSSVYGVGEGLVSGRLDADSFWLNSSDGTLIRSEIVEKKEMLGKNKKDSTCQILEVSANLVHNPSLSPAELSRLFEAANKIHTLFQRPQDIEWAILGKQIYILQSRPVTAFDSNLIGTPNLWDNSNIVESYGGLTSPLSFSFALRNYRNVYIQFCEVLGVPSDIIKDMDSYLAYMLGCIRGRVYYNLFNWYKLVGVLPGFQQNKEFMETMMGVSETLTQEIAERIKPHPSWNTPLGQVRKFWTGLNFIKYHLFIQGIVDDFLTTFHRDYDRTRSLPLRQMRADQLLSVYMDLERNMLGRWKAPIINDFLCMVHFGLLRKLTLKWLPKLDSTLQNDLLAGEGGLESAEPTRALLDLAIKADKIPELKSLLLDTDPALALEALNQSAFQDFFQEIQAYLDRFGFRCMSEMKLEEIDLMTDPSALFVFLKNYLRQGNLKVHDDSREKNLRSTAEEKIKKQLSPRRRILYFWVLKHARKAVKNRENTRFARTRIYGIARSIFNGIGEDLAQQNILKHPRDIFWLTIEEVFGIFNGTLPSDDLGGLIQIRKKSYESFNEEPDPRIMTRGPVYWQNPLRKPEEPESTIAAGADETWDLKGLPCCPGILEGTVKVILSPTDNLELNGEILVTARTDPGWVPLYPSISGLLVERGSLLSHSAIVAREMGKPSIVSIPGLTKVLKTGMRIRMDGKAGTIEILK
jgi:phosphohistidine swiveling domain-containing protein